MPEFGGEPLPPAPICLPRDYRKAQLYLVEIRKALAGYGWSRRQRKILHDLLRKWTFRAEGRDEHFEQWGSFPPRHPGSPPPSAKDVILSTWRREERARRASLPPGERKPQALPRRFRDNLKGKTADDPRFRSEARTKEIREEQGHDDED